MPRQQTKPQAQRQRTIDAVATFTALMHALERELPEQAADAKAELARLGIAVRLTQPEQIEMKGAGQ